MRKSGRSFLSQICGVCPVRLQTRPVQRNDVDHRFFVGMDPSDGCYREIDFFRQAGYFHFQLRHFADLAFCSDIRTAAGQRLETAGDTAVGKAAVISADVSGVGLLQRFLQEAKVGFGNENFKLAV